MFVLSWQIVTDPLSVERLLGQTGDLSRPQLVEFCVVCGDKASGNRITLSMQIRTWVCCIALACFQIWWYCMSVIYFFCLQAVITERSVVRGVKASSSVVWGRTWPTAAGVNRTVSLTNTTVIAASSVGLENALRWGWRLSVSQIKFTVLSLTYSCKGPIVYSGQMCPVWIDAQ